MGTMDHDGSDRGRPHPPLPRGPRLCDTPAVSDAIEGSFPSARIAFVRRGFARSLGRAAVGTAALALAFSLALDVLGFLVPVAIVGFAAAASLVLGALSLLTRFDVLARRGAITREGDR